jgi:hypothetical protein
VSKILVSENQEPIVPTEIAGETYRYLYETAKKQSVALFGSLDRLEYAEPQEITLTVSKPDQVVSALRQLVTTLEGGKFGGQLDTKDANKLIDNAHDERYLGTHKDFKDRSGVVGSATLVAPNPTRRPSLPPLHPGDVPQPLKPSPSPPLRTWSALGLGSGIIAGSQFCY